MKERVALDVSKLPMSGNGTASPTWWGTCAFMLIEGTGFALAVAVYFYLMSLALRWPIDAPPPDLSAGTVLTALLVVSVVPNVLVSRWARQRRLVHVRFGLVVMSAIGLVLLAMRRL